jgi:hypothetical protein
MAYAYFDKNLKRDHLLGYFCFYAILKKNQAQAIIRAHGKFLSPTQPMI